eukprot:gnl/Trimastix_PCT/419.p2 GENE.gnl/Trimastix_PCT/419~~gnl/Trimastix_PCT/419.p2  ORF type:complete len:316 (-),score=102.90 gnl/Trimastix_PCT/419:85-1032(-)
MNKVLAFFALLVLVLCNERADKLINAVNSHPDTLWTAGRNERFYDMSHDDLSHLCGVLPRPADAPAVQKIRLLGDDEIPKEFDCRNKWSECIGPILDQGHCGSCWAFGAIETFQDRICIFSNGTRKVVLSEQDLTSCHYGCMGCRGGWIDSAYSYLKEKGAVSEKCYPYEMGTCKHPGCKTWPTPDCKDYCKEGSGLEYAQDKHFAAHYYALYSVEDIQREIMRHGPVEASFTIYGDFGHYKQGVYRHMHGEAAGGHAIKIIGWGETDDGTPYWIVQNSWRTDWGNKGYFWILRGQDECGIESDVWAVTPRLYDN